MSTNQQYNITLPDYSPSIQYLPYQDGPISDGWNSTCSSSQDSSWFNGAPCVGTSGHRTNSPQASLTISFQGTGIYLFGSTQSSASPPYSVTLDGASGTISNQGGLLFGASGLKYGPHTVSLNNSNANSLSVLTFTEAVLTIEVPSDTTNKTIQALDGNVHDPFVSYNGQWSASVQLDQTTSYPRSDTQVAGDTMSFTLTQTTAFFMYGSVAADHSTFESSLGPTGGSATTKVFNGSAHWRVLGSLLYWESGLDPSKQYTVQITNLGVGTTPWFDFNNIVLMQSNATSSPSNPGSPSSPNSPSSSTSKGLSTGAAIGIGVGGGIVVLLCIVLIFFCCSKKRRNSRNQIQTPTHGAPLFNENAATIEPLLLSGYQTTEFQPDQVTQGSSTPMKHSQAYGSSLGYPSPNFGPNSQPAFYNQTPSGSSSALQSTSGDRTSQYTGSGSGSGSHVEPEQHPPRARTRSHLREKVVVEEDAGPISERNAEFLPPGYRDEWRLGREQSDGAQ